MTDSNYTHLLAVVDRSGSMATIDEDMRGGLNEFFKSQAELPGKCLIDYVQFDTQYEQVYEDRPVGYAKATLEPRGGTALLDAIGRSVTQLGGKLRNLPEHARPGKVLVIVVTDGEENSSHEWTAERVRALVKQQENDYGWVFTFLGANIDAVEVGYGFGFSRGNSMTYAASAAGVSNTMSSLSSFATRYRGGESVIGYTDDDRDAAEET